jgi:hypothetical protein
MVRDHAMPPCRANSQVIGPVRSSGTVQVVRAWWAQLSGPVRALAVVVPGVAVQHVSQVLFPEDQQPVGEFGANGEHEPLGVGVRLGTARRNLQHGDAGVGQHGVEGDGELAGPVPDQGAESGRTLAQIQQQVPPLLGRPRPVRVGGDAQDADGARLDLQHDQHIEPPQRHRVDAEDVDREHPGGLGAQELPPAGVVAADRRRRYPDPFEDAADGRRADPMAEFEQSPWMRL